MKRLLWTEGTLLSQQHFQQWQKELDKHINFNDRYVKTDHWGVVNMVLDEDAISMGYFTLAEGRFIFQHGEKIEITPIDKVTRSLDTLSDGMHTLCLAIAMDDNAEGISGYDTSNQAVKWIGAYQEVLDIHDNNRQREVLFGKINLQVLSQQDDVTSGFYMLPVYQIQKSNHIYAVDKTFVPPTLTIAESSLFNTKLDHYINQCKHFSDSVINRITAQVGVKPPAEMVIVLHTLAQFHGEFTQLKQGKHNHPRLFFHALVQLYIALCALVVEKSREMPAYQHENMAVSLNAVEGEIKRLFRKLLPKPINPITLIEEHPGIYSAKKIDGHYLQNYDFYLSVNISQCDEENMTHFINLIKVSACSEMQMLLSSALPGVTVRYIRDLPHQIVTKSNQYVFAIEKIGKQWVRICETKSLCVFLPASYRDSKVSLLTVERL